MMSVEKNPVAAQIAIMHQRQAATNENEDSDSPLYQVRP